MATSKIFEPAQEFHGIPRTISIKGAIRWHDCNASSTIYPFQVKPISLVELLALQAEVRGTTRK